MDIKSFEASQEHLPESLRAKFFDTGKGVYDINGTTYYYQPNLKTIRNSQFQQLSINISSESTIQYLFDELSAALGVIMQSNSIAESLIRAHQILFSVVQRIGDINSKVENQDMITYVHEMCALLLVTENEDTRQINEAVMKKKYADFIESDYAYHAFFFLALNHIADFQLIMQKISEFQKAMAQ